MTLAVIITLISSFSFRIFGTLFPGSFTSITVVKATILVNTLFVFSYFLFWLIFCREYISARKHALKGICILVIAGIFAVSLVHMKELPFVFGADFHFPLFFADPYYDAFVPLLSSAFHLIFFVAFAMSLEHEEEYHLRAAVHAMIIGNSIYFCLHLFVLLHFLATEKFAWLEHMHRAFALATVPLIIAAFFLMAFFYYRFYRFLGSNHYAELTNTVHS